MWGSRPRCHGDAPLDNLSQQPLLGGPRLGPADGGRRAYWEAKVTLQGDLGLGLSFPPSKAARLLTLGDLRKKPRKVVEVGKGHMAVGVGSGGVRRLGVWWHGGGRCEREE